MTKQYTLDGRRIHWRKTAEHCLDGGAIGEYNGDPDSNAMELARATMYLLERIAKLERVARIASHFQQHLNNNELSIALAALDEKE